MPTSLCATLSANLQSTTFSASPVDPSVDNAAAVTASSSASNPDTSRIQAALTGCASGSAVKLVASSSDSTYNAFLTGPLTLPTGVTLWIDSGVTLYASRHPSDYDAGTSGYCGGAFTSTPSGSGCKALITVASGAANSGIVGYGTIDGRGGSRLTGASTIGSTSTLGMTWWDVAWTSKVSGYSSYSQNCPTLLDLTQGGSNFKLAYVALVNSPHFHVKIDSYKTLTAWGVKLLTPTLAYSASSYSCSTVLSTSSLPSASTTYCYTPDYTKNTDGIDPGGSDSVTIAYSYISVGDDNVAVTASNTGGGCTVGTNSYCASTNTKIAHNYFYYGHGMSVGSGTQGGVSGLQVWDLSIDGKSSSNGAGLRIKSYSSAGGAVSASYTKVCIQNEKQPIWVDPYYSSSTGTLYPSFGTISYESVHVVTSSSAATYKGGTISMNGYNATYPATFSLNNVYFDTAPTWSASSNVPSAWDKTVPNYASFTIGSSSTNFAIATTGLSTSISSGTANSYAGTVLDCSSAFPTFTSATGRTDSPI